MGTFAHMEHEGNVLKKLVLKFTTEQQLADQLGNHRNTLAQWFKKPVVDSSILIKIGKALRYDLSTEFPRLKSLPEIKELNFFNADPSSYVKEIKQVIESSKQTIADRELEIKLLKDKINDLRYMIEDKNLIIAAKDQQIEMLHEKIKAQSGAKSA